MPSAIKSVAFALLNLLLLSGCAASSENSAEFSKVDIMFAEMMIPHHEQAVVMSDIALTNSSNPEIQTLAESIRGAQAPEIEQMASWPGVDSMGHAGHMMDGMLSEAEIEELRAASGAEFDRLFLEGMIKHHKGALEMAEMVLDSDNAEVATLAKAIVDAQTREIAEMEALLSLR
jgi:uncharacterized protein (DUF305 family)